MGATDRRHEDWTEAGAMLEVVEVVLMLRGGGRR